MLTKNQLQSIISKYYLGGTVEAVKWNIEDKNLTIEFMSPTKDTLGKVVFPNFPLQNSNLAIFNTSQLIKLTSIIQGEILLNIGFNKNIPMRLDISDTQFNVNYTLADPIIIGAVAKLEEPSIYEIELDLDQENISALIKSKNAIGDDNTVLIENSLDETGNNVILFTFGANEEYSNKITYSISTDSNFNVKLLFPSNIIKEILSANKDMDKGKIYINSEGLLKMSFLGENGFISEYYIVCK